MGAGAGCEGADWEGLKFERESLWMRWCWQKERTRVDHFVSWAWWVVRFVWRVKKGGKWYSRGKTKGSVIFFLAGWLAARYPSEGGDLKNGGV